MNKNTEQRDPSIRITYTTETNRLHHYVMCIEVYHPGGITEACELATSTHGYLHKRIEKLEDDLSNMTEVKNRLLSQLNEIREFLK